MVWCQNVRLPVLSGIAVFTRSVKISTVEMEEEEEEGQLLTLRSLEIFVTGDKMQITFDHICSG